MEGSGWPVPTNVNALGAKIVEICRGSKTFASH